MKRKIDFDTNNKNVLVYKNILNGTQRFCCKRIYARYNQVYRTFTSARVFVILVDFYNSLFYGGIALKSLYNLFKRVLKRCIK